MSGVLGTLHDAGNTTTLAAYLRLLAHAFLVVPLERFSGSRVKQRGSIPKLLVLDNALVTAMLGLSFAQAKRQPALWGRLIENAVGAHLYWWAQERGAELRYWRDRQDEVDFVLGQGPRLLAVEVKSGVLPTRVGGLEVFGRRYPHSRVLVIGAHPGSGAIAHRQMRTLSQFFVGGFSGW